MSRLRYMRRLLGDLAAYGWNTGRWASAVTIIAFLLIAAIMVVAAATVPVVVYTLF